ncbi:BUD13 homolog [Phymastichus coffea]|uniref:BUD13 homolog n=1 Tax=Phymastichus coffea TaxID=108790 RepID=UPI00273CA732|nr:BUD13 homolog [Phymastichus coffea]
MEAQKIDQKEYLKRYLSKKDDRKKKKKKKLKVGPKKVQIIDDDIDLKNLATIDDEEISIFNATEDAPQIVGIIDERGPDFDNKQRWKVIADDGTGDIAIQEIGHSKKSTRANGKQESNVKDNKLEKKLKERASKKKKAANSSGLDSSEDKKFKKHKKNKSSKKKKKKRHSTLSLDPEDSDSDCDKRNMKRKNSDKRKKDSNLDLSSPHDSSREESRSNNISMSIEESKSTNISVSRENSDSDSGSLGDFNKKNTKSQNTSKERQNSDSDISPFRDSSRKKSRSQTTSKTRQDSDSDLSPPRESNRKKSKSKNTSKRRRNSDSDLSPPRSNTKRSESPLRNSRKSQSQDSDLSPPRTSKNKSKKYDSFNTIKSKSLRMQNKSDSDLSPPRSKKFKNCKDLDENDSDFSLPNNGKLRADTHSRKSKINYDSDLSPPRHSRQEHGKPEKYSGHRPKSGWDVDSKPSHNSERSRSRHISPMYSYSKSSSSKWDRKKSPSPNRKSDSHRKNDDRNTSPACSVTSQTKKKRMSDGRSAGLTNLQTLMEEDKERKRREEEQLRNMSREESGYGQATIVRGKKRRDLEQNAAEERERQKEQNEINAKYAKWGKGLKQVKDRDDRLKRDLHEMSKPLARYADDQDLERELRAVEREEDPMLAYIKEKEIKEGKRAPDKPKYEGAYMPNRFGIKPGHRWDGVDRSNGYEAKWFEAQNSKKANEKEAYEYLTADM